MVIRHRAIGGERGNAVAEILSSCVKKSGVLRAERRGRGGSEDEKQ
jgi:hypothetical protein